MKYIFNGRVLPERAYVSLPERPFDVSNKEGKFRFAMKVSISCAQISAKVELLEGNPDIFTLKNTVDEVIGGYVDAFGYLIGCGYEVEIISATPEDATTIPTVFGVNIPVLEDMKSERPLPLEDVVNNMNNSPFLLYALGDLRESIRSPYAGFFCYRAIESVRQEFVRPEDNQNRNPSWEKLRNALRIDEDSLIKFGKDYSNAQRHGYPQYMSSEERAKVFRYTWRVADRFILYLNKGKIPLDELEFPLLKF